MRGVVKVLISMLRYFGQSTSYRVQEEGGEWWGYISTYLGRL